MDGESIIFIGFLLFVIGLISLSLWLETHAPPANNPCPDCASDTRHESQALDPPSSLGHRRYGTFQLASSEDESSTFQRLPPEILDLVMDPLSPLNLRCLKMTCRRFYHHSHHTKTNFTTDWERFHLRCVLERDQTSFQRLICGCCHVHHDRSQFFPSEERKKDPFQRGCMTYKPVLRVCPHSTLSFSTIRSRANSYLGNPICNHASCTLGGAPALGTFLGDYTISKRHYLTMVSTLRWPSISEVKKLLQVYNVPMCPHLTLGHSYVLGAYRPLEEVFENRCSYCDTHFQFRLFELCSNDRAMPGSNSLNVFVTRNIGRLYYPTDPTWLSQLCVVKEPDLSNYWVNCITFSHSFEIDKRKRFRGNMPCGGSVCDFKAQIKESENMLERRTTNIKSEIGKLSHGGLLLGLPYDGPAGFFIEIQGQDHL